MMCFAFLLFFDLLWCMKSRHIKYVISIYRYMAGYNRSFLSAYISPIKVYVFGISKVSPITLIQIICNIFAMISFERVS